MDQLAQWWSYHPWTFIAAVAILVALGKTRELAAAIREPFAAYRKGASRER